MILVDLTLHSPHQNIAFDEAILESAETHDSHPELLRFWEPREPLVVLGRSSPFETEVNHRFCDQHQIPVIRRCSGGQSIVTGPGCLMYAVLLDYRKRPELRMLDVAHQFVMNRMREAIAATGVETSIQGTSDLTIKGQKFSGNSLRCKRNWMIYHGTMICDLEIDLIANCLGEPIRQPEYRSKRDHRNFLVQLKTTVDSLKASIAKVWSAKTGDYAWPQTLTEQLVKEKYATEAWNRKV